MNEIRVGLTERHGSADEASAFPPPGVQYLFPTPSSKVIWPLGSEIKGFLSRFDNDDECDLYEAVLCPIRTNSRWICNLGSIHSALAFNFLSVPIPRRIRLRYLERWFLRENFRKLIFRSEAAMAEFLTAVPYVSTELIDKSAVVYPAIRPWSRDFNSDRDSETITLLFSGFFFRKGGASVVDAFIKLQSSHPGLQLRLCCDPDLDFETPNQSLRNEYLSKISNNSAITLGRVSRAEMLNNILPQSDIFVMPTYNEAFGFAILEAMAQGLPVVSTHHFAIPEMIEHNRSGFLIDFGPFDVAKLFPRYTVNEIPTRFHELVTDQLQHFLGLLVQSQDLRLRFGSRAREIIVSKFSIEKRNQTMLTVYRDAIA